MVWAAVMIGAKVRVWFPFKDCAANAKPHSAFHLIIIMLNKVVVTTTSTIAQGKRAGLITLRSLDRNQVVLSLSEIRVFVPRLGVCSIFQGVHFIIHDLGVNF